MKYVGENFLRLGLSLILGLTSSLLLADEWRSEPMTPIDLSYLNDQRNSIDELARRHFGRMLNGQKANDIPIMQRLLDENIVGASDVRQLQAMGLILGELLKAEKGLSWAIYYDKYGRSRALQVAGFEKEFIFPATQISRKVEVGLSVSVDAVYQELEQAVIDIRNSPPF